MKKIKVLAVLLTVSGLSGCSDSPTEVVVSMHDDYCSVENIDDLAALSSYLTPEGKKKDDDDYNALKKNPEFQKMQVAIIADHKKLRATMCSKPFEVTDVKIDGDLATVKIDGLVGILPMKKIDGEWKIDDRNI